MRCILVLLCSGLFACGLAADIPSDHNTYTRAAETPLRITGRTDTHTDGSISFGYPAVSLELIISGGTLAMTAFSSNGENQLALTVDDQAPIRITPGKTAQAITLSESTQPRHIRISHLGETWHGVVTIAGFSLSGGEYRAPPSPQQRKLLVIGDSVTCGEAVERTTDCTKTKDWWNPDESWGMLLARALNAEAHLVCYGGRGLMRSWNGNTEDLQAPDFINLSLATEDGPSWDHGRYQPALIVVSVGTNDFSLSIGALPERDQFVNTYTAFVGQLLQLYPKADIVLTEGAIVNDKADPQRPQKSRLREYISATLANVDNARVHQIQAQHYPGDSCDAHPTGEQHRAMAKDLLDDLQTISGWR
ncbi:MAG TPA: GDSL-type esterase/lipase family protein [Cellvibrionaceae bacterium]